LKSSRGEHYQGVQTSAVLTLTKEDPRMQTGAYITDGISLYEVRGVQRAPGRIGHMAMRLMLEDCYSFHRVEFLVDKIRRSFTLVRPAPAASCPDMFEEIAWEGEARTPAGS
jgi:hypothetical protein